MTSSGTNIPTDRYFGFRAYLCINRVGDIGLYLIVSESKMVATTTGKENIISNRLGVQSNILSLS